MSVETLTVRELIDELARLDPARRTDVEQISIVPGAFIGVCFFPDEDEVMKRCDVARAEALKWKAKADKHREILRRIKATRNTRRIP